MNQKREKGPLRGVYLITNTELQQQFSHAELARQAVEAGVRLVQYRDKQASGHEALAQVREITKVTRSSNTLCIVNDRCDWALAGGADGVHLGQEDLPAAPARRVLGDDTMIGRTAATLEEALQAEEDGADYVALGHIFPTDTKKKEYAPRGVEMLREVCRKVSLPVVAIGGITLENAPEVIAAGADCIAVCSAVCSANHPAREAKKFVDLFA